MFRFVIDVLMEVYSDEETSLGFFSGPLPSIGSRIEQAWRATRPQSMNLGDSVVRFGRGPECLRALDEINSRSRRDSSHFNESPEENRSRVWPSPENDWFIDPPKENIEVSVYPAPYIERIMDVLGFYRTDNPDSVYLCHAKLSGTAQRMNASYATLMDVVLIHEYAHLIHDLMNPHQFRRGFGLFPDPKFYVEGWAQYCTWLVVRELGGLHLEVFDKLCQNQAPEYKYFLHFREATTSQLMKEFQVCELFLSSEGWAYLPWKENKYVELVSSAKLSWEGLAESFAESRRLDGKSEYDSSPFLSSIWRDLPEDLKRRLKNQEALSKLLNSQKFKKEAKDDNDLTGLGF